MKKFMILTSVVFVAILIIAVCLINEESECIINDGVIQLSENDQEVLHEFLEHWEKTMPTSMGCVWRIILYSKGTECYKFYIGRIQDTNRYELILDVDRYGVNGVGIKWFSSDGETDTLYYTERKYEEAYPDLKELGAYFYNSLRTRFREKESGIVAELNIHGFLKRWGKRDIVFTDCHRYTSIGAGFVIGKNGEPISNQTIVKEYMFVFYSKLQNEHLMIKFRCDFYTSKLNFSEIRYVESEEKEYSITHQYPNDTLDDMENELRKMSIRFMKYMKGSGQKPTKPNGRKILWI